MGTSQSAGAPLPVDVELVAVTVVLAVTTVELTVAVPVVTGGIVPVLVGPSPPLPPSPPVEVESPEPPDLSQPAKYSQPRDTATNATFIERPMWFSSIASVGAAWRGDPQA
jgi:hypothetical protein